MAEELACQQLLYKDVIFRLGRIDGGDRKVKLKIFIGLTSSSSATHKKELHIRLTDETDPFFLQFLYLAEDDFQSLKSQQGLLVDFSAFPQKFIDLIDLCSKEENENNPRFLLQFKLSGSDSKSSGVLDIVETNPFKHLIHLSLKFLPGGDEEIKKYLAKCLKNLKDEKETLVQKVSCLETDFATKYSSISQKLQERTQELENLKSEWNERINESSSKHYAELKSAKEYGLQLQNSYEEKIMKERREWEEKHRKTIERLEKRIIETDASNKDLMDRKYKNESKIREMQSRLSNFEEECRHMNKEIQALRRQNTSLDSERHDRDKTLNHLRTRVAVLEQELKDKEQVITRSSELLETSNEQKKMMEEELRGKTAQINKLEATVKSVSDEVLKGNEIILKLQNEIRNTKSQIKLKNIVTTKQERIIEEKEEILIKQQKEIDEYSKKVNSKDQEIQKLTIEFENVKQKLEESQDLARTNENVINWLNKQLNNQNLGPNRFGVNDVTSNSANNTASRISSTRSSMHHSTPSAGYIPYVPNVGNNIFNDARPNQVLYRPVGPRKPPAWHSPPSSHDSVTPNIATTTINNRQPLRQQMPNSQPISEQPEPAIDMKYLQKKPREPTGVENTGVLPGMQNKRTVRPFPVSGGHRNGDAQHSS